MQDFQGTRTRGVIPRDHAPRQTIGLGGRRQEHGVGHAQGAPPPEAESLLGSHKSASLPRSSLPESTAHSRPAKFHNTQRLLLEGGRNVNFRGRCAPMAACPSFCFFLAAVRSQTRSPSHLVFPRLVHVRRAVCASTASTQHEDPSGTLAAVGSENNDRTRAALCATGGMGWCWSVTLWATRPLASLGCAGEDGPR
jgi:hypothetical protein